MGICSSCTAGIIKSNRYILHPGTNIIQYLALDISNSPCRAGSGEICQIRKSTCPKFLASGLICSHSIIGLAIGLRINLPIKCFIISKPILKPGCNPCFVAKGRNRSWVACPFFCATTVFAAIISIKHTDPVTGLDRYSIYCWSAA